MREDGKRLLVPSRFLLPNRSNEYPGGYAFKIELAAGEMTRPTPWLPGLTLFMYAASIHLLLLQEIALWQKLPLKGKGSDVGTWADIYAKYLSGALLQLQTGLEQYRRQQIHVDSIKFAFGGHLFVWKDDQTGQAGTPTADINQAKAAMSQHITTVLGEQKQQLAKLTAIAEMWHSLS